MVNPPAWQSILADIERHHRQLQKTLLWLDEGEHQTALPATGQTPVQLMETLCHQQRSIVHEVQEYCQETSGKTPPALSLTEAFLEGCHQSLVYFRDRMEEAATADLPMPISVQVRAACQHLVTQVAATQSMLADYWFSLARWGRPGLREFVAAQFDVLLDSVGGLPEESLCEKVVAGTWTARDILIHVLIWEEYGWEILHQWPRPDPQSLRPWAYDDMDQGNQVMVEARRHLDLIDVLGDLYTYRRRTLQFIDARTEAELAGVGSYGWDEKGTLSAFLLQMAQHRNEHAQTVWAAREAGLLP